MTEPTPNADHVAVLRQIRQTIEAIDGAAWSYGQRRGMTLWKALDQIDYLVTEALRIDGYDHAHGLDCDCRFPTRDADEVRSRLLDWADELCPEWAEDQYWQNEAARHTVARARLLRRAAALLSDGCPSQENGA